MKEHFQKLFAYDAWANEKIVSSIGQLATPDERCLHLLSHIFAAQEIWLGRISGKLSPLAPFTDRNLSESIEAFRNFSKEWKDYLDASSETELTRIVSYKNTKGEQYKTAVNDILTHVINHSTYHRGQIVAALKGKIEKLPVTDFIVFVGNSYPSKWIENIIAREKSLSTTLE